jgi:hypothetical protein
MDIQHEGFSMHHQDQTADLGNERGGGVCLFVNNSWC